MDEGEKGIDQKQGEEKKCYVKEVRTNREDQRVRVGRKMIRNLIIK